MATNTYRNKVIFGDTVLIDLTADTVTPDKILAGFTAHDQSGAAITGTCEFDVDSGDATVQVAEILKDKTAYARGAKLTGTMPTGVSFYTFACISYLVDVSRSDVDPEPNLLKFTTYLTMFPKVQQGPIARY